MLHHDGNCKKNLNKYPWRKDNIKKLLFLIFENKKTQLLNAIYKKIKIRELK